MKKLLKAMIYSALLLTFTACESSKTPQEIIKSEPPAGTELVVIEEEFDISDMLKAQIILSTEHQTMLGFGASYTWYADWALPHPGRREEIADLLFKDAKLTILRFKNDYEPFEPDHKSKEVQFYNMAKERAAEYSEEVTVLMSSWSPPARLKSNNSINGCGTINKNDDGEYMYAEFAGWWADSIEAYRSAGTKIDYISIQNECDFTSSYDGMELAKFETDSKAEYAKAFITTYNELQSRFGSDAPLMLGPETMSFNTSDLKSYMKNITDEFPEAVAGVAFHMYVGGNSQGEGGEGNGKGRSTNEPDDFNKNFFENLGEFGDRFDLWQTEFYRGRPMQTAILMNNALVNGNVNAYLHWTGVWDRKFPSHDLIGLDSRGNYTVGSSYYVMRHFSEFIRPGYIRTQVNYPYKSDLRVSAFKSPDGSKLAIVLINTTYENMEVALPIEDAKVADSVVYQTALKEDEYESDEYYVNLGSMGKGNTVTLGAYSITTIDINLE